MKLSWEYSLKYHRHLHRLYLDRPELDDIVFSDGAEVLGVMLIFGGIVYGVHHRGGAVPGLL